MMTSADYVMVLLVLISAAVGVWRGFVTEAMSLAALVAALVLAWLFGGVVEPLLGEWDSAVEVRLWAARVIVFVTVLVIGGVASWLARKFVGHTGLTGLDRALGAVFGVARAAVFIGLGVIVIELVELEQESWWRDARLRPYAEQAAAAVRYFSEVGVRAVEEAGASQARDDQVASVEASSV
jgi:membrane protein required for colicin V production